MKKLLEWFVALSVGFFTFGFALNITTGTSDVYQLWFMLVFIAGAYLWSNK